MAVQALIDLFNSFSFGSKALLAQELQKLGSNLKSLASGKKAKTQTTKSDESAFQTPVSLKSPRRQWRVPAGAAKEH